MFIYAAGRQEKTSEEEGGEEEEEELGRSRCAAHLEAGFFLLGGKLGSGLDFNADRRVLHRTGAVIVV